MEKPFVSYAVVEDNGEFLLVRRARNPFEGYWGFIAGTGGAKKGLPPEQAVLDEVRHDIGTDYIEPRFCFDYPINTDYANRVFVFLGRVSRESIRLNPRAATDIRWFTEKAVRTEKRIAFDNKWIIEKISGQYI